MRRTLHARLAELERPTHPFAEQPPREDVVRARWVAPVPVGEVEYRDFTQLAGRLRHTAWHGLGDDRRPADILAAHPAPTTKPTPAQGAEAVDETPSPTPRTPASAGAQRVRVGDRRLTLSNLDKPRYPDGFTRPEGVVFVFDGGMLDTTDLVGMVFPDREILSAAFCSLEQARDRVKPLLADRPAAALEAIGQGVTVLCEQGKRIA